MVDVRRSPSGEVLKVAGATSTRLLRVSTLGAAPAGGFVDWWLQSMIGDWSIVSDGGPAGNASAILPPQDALGGFVRFYGAVYLRGDAPDAPDNYQVSAMLQRFDAAQLSTEQLFLAYEQQGNTTGGHFELLPFCGVIDLRTVTERRNAQILLQALSGPNVVSGGYSNTCITFECFPFVS